MEKDPTQLPSYMAVQQLRVPGAATLASVPQWQKCQLPVPPVDVRQAWAKNNLERFAGRFLITTNDFDDNGNFYVNNDVTMRLQTAGPAKPAPTLSLKQRKLLQIKQNRGACPPPRPPAAAPAFSYRSDENYEHSTTAVSNSGKGPKTTASSATSLNFDNSVNEDDFVELEQEDEFIRQQIRKVNK